MNFDYQRIMDLLTLENIIEFFESYAALGPIPGFALPFIEAFLPVLPLFLFVLANAAAFGLWKGFLLSWLGTCAGSIVVFFLIRKLGKRKIFQGLRENKNVKKFIEWPERYGFGPLFLLLCFPFSPSSLINVVAGLSKVNTFQFLLAVLLGKFVMIFTISWIGHDIVSLVKEPIKTGFLFVFIFILWYVGKRVEVYLQVRAKKQKKYE